MAFFSNFEVIYAVDCLQSATRNGDRAAEKDAYFDLGNAYGRQEDYSRAIHCFQQSLSIAKELNDREREKIAYRSIGDSFFNAENYVAAIEYFEKAAITAKEMGDKKFEGTLYNRLGAVNQIVSRYEKAIECHVKYLNISKELNDKSAQGNAYSDLGATYASCGKYHEAMENLENGLSIAHEVGNRKLEANIQCNLGVIYQELGRFDDAIKQQKKSLEFAIKNGNKLFEGKAYNNLGINSYELGEYHNAIKYLEKGLEIAKITKKKTEEGKVCTNIGMAYYSLHDYQKAIEYHKMSLEIAKEVGDTGVEGLVYGNLGIAYRSLRQYPKAIECYEKDLSSAKNSNNQLAEAIAYNNLGNAYFQLYLNTKHCNEGSENLPSTLLQKSERFCNESIKSYECLFGNVGEQDQYKVSIVDTYIMTYKLLTAVYIESGQTEKALFISERKRARALEDILTAKYNLERKRGSRHQDIQEYADVESKVLNANCSVLFFSELISADGNALGLWALDLENPFFFYQNDLKEVKTKLEELLVNEEIQKSENNDILLDLVDKTYTTMSVRGVADCENRSFNIHDGDTTGDVASSAQDPGRVKRCVFDEELDDDYLEVLFDAIITPVQDKLTHDEIVIIPDGPLFQVPFAALRDPNTKRCLAETKRIRIVPSLTTLKILKETSADSHSMTGALIVGDPDVDGKRMFKGKEIFFNPLPNARIEAEKIGEVLGVTAVTGTQATKQAIKQRLREGVAVIHFATHGSSDSGEIVLSPPADLQGTKKVPDEEDYLLTINEVQEIGLRARLVVLSCCHSGRGEIKSEGVIGMSRAFLAAGARAVVASLWAVDDRGTRVFMEKFYAHLMQGKSASVCLQQAMKEMREMVRYEKPMFWAPFVLIGDDVTIRTTLN